VRDIGGRFLLFLISYDAVLTFVDVGAVSNFVVVAVVVNVIGFLASVELTVLIFFQRHLHLA
jgi:hypothetical protein